MNLIFEDNEMLSGTELKRRLNICNKTWDRHRLRILEHLSLYCDFEVLGNSPRYIYHILHQFSEYEKFNSRISKKERNNEIYTKEIVKSVKRHPLATYTSINYDIVDKPTIKELNHTWNTSYGYVRNCTAISFGKGKGNSGKIGRVSDKIWARKIRDQWYELPEDQFIALKEYFKETFNGIEEKTVDIITDKENNVITPQEAKEQITVIQEASYNKAMIKFENMFHFRPRKVYKYELTAWYEKILEENIMA